ncbi:LysR substrate-binding domain-containing protein [Saccharothrix texasensis]|uniref:LysR substrate-binding domain-containing protein n=1 Tax=Saccharothrix texasensis TaxID=103734 RepID=UPI001476DE4F|nr:LysR substrate-binding domain-containing protein [Saccharothrix texasensis]
MPDLRFGYHGSLELPHAAVRADGYDPGRVEFVEYDVGDPFTPLRRGRVDVMVSKFDHREPDLVYSEPIGLDPRAVVVALDHPLAGRESVSVEEVAAFPCFDRPGFMPAEVWDQLVPPVTPGGRPITRGHPFTAVPALMRTVASGAAVHLTVQSIAHVAPPTVTLVPVRDLRPAVINLVWLPTAPQRVRRLVRAAEGLVAS